MRLEAKTAIAIGILLPALETCRRGLGEWGADITTMFTDYFAGALLLVGGWAAYRRRTWSGSFLLLAWAWVTGMMANSTFDQLEETLRAVDLEPHNSLVLAVKALLTAISTLSLALSFRRNLARA